MASVGGRSKPIAARPSGAATTVSAPLRTTTAFSAAAAARARASLLGCPRISGRPRNSRANSPSCGVTIVARRCSRDQHGEARRVAGKARQRVGVEHDRARRRARLGQRRRDERARRVADAGAGAEKNGVAPGVGEQRREPARPENGATITAVEWAALTSDRVGRAGERDEPGADPQGGARRQPRRAGAMRGAGEDQRRAARIFVRSRAGARQRMAPDRRRVDEGARRDCPQRARRAADLREREAPARSAARQQQMARLQAKEGDAGARLDRHAAHGAGFAVDPRGDVDAEDRLAAAREGVDAPRRSASAAPSRSRDSPAPNRASTTRSAAPRSSASAGATGPCQRAAASAASPRSAARSPSRPRLTR